MALIVKRLDLRLRSRYASDASDSAANATESTAHAS